jgi:hypothetical protein
MDIYQNDENPISSIPVSEYEKITMYPIDDQNIQISSMIEKEKKQLELDDKIQKAISEQEKQLTNLKYIYVNTKSNYIFFSILFLFFILLGFYIYFKLSSNQPKSSDDSQIGNNFNFYNHTGWSDITPNNPTCKLFSIEKIDNDYFVDYKNPKNGSCLDSYYVSGSINTKRSCISDQCINFKGEIDIFGSIETFTEDGTTPFPTCNLNPCEDSIYRIISFIDNEPFCATITYKIATNVLDPEKTAFLPCDPLDRNQLFRIKRRSTYGGNNEKGSALDIISRTTQEYLYITESGVLSSSLNFTQQSWLYTPTVQLTNNIIIPSQLVYMDPKKLNEFPDYNPLSEETFNILNIPKGYNYTPILTNLYSMANFGYLSARQYQQLCLLEGVGNTACYNQLMIISENEYQIKISDNSLKYEYTGDL